MNTEQLWTLLDKYKTLKQTKNEQSTKSRILDLQAEVIKEVETQQLSNQKKKQEQVEIKKKDHSEMNKKIREFEAH